MPKSEYRPVDTVQQENEDNILTSTYTSAVVYRALPHGKDYWLILGVLNFKFQRFACMYQRSVVS